MLKKALNYLVISDIHLGHKKNPTGNIINNLRLFFKDNERLFKKLDVIFIAGDLFDRLLNTNSKDFEYIMEWLTDLILYCKANNITLRTLEGTPLHDWKQAKVFTTIINKLNIDVDYKYISTLHIEKNKKLGINILYVPDEWNAKAEDTYKEVQKLLVENKLKQVDIAIMHGQFHHQLPMVKLESSHNENDYLDIVKYYIHIGHIHTPSNFDRIIAQGSFDRLKHNEEEDKGAAFATLLPNDQKEHIFLKNKRAATFKTFEYDSIDIEKIIPDLTKKINKLNVGSHVRVIVNQDDLLIKSVKALKSKYPFIHIDIERKGKNKITVKDDELLSKVAIDSFSIDKNNIEELMLEEASKYNPDNKQIKIMKDELKMINESI